MISFDIFSVKLQHLKCIINAIEKKCQKFWSALWLACCLSKAFEVVWRLVHHLCITFKNPFFKSWFWKIKANFVFLQENFVTLHRYINISGFFLLKIARGCWSLPCTDVFKVHKIRLQFQRFLTTCPHKSIHGPPTNLGLQT